MKIYRILTGLRGKWYDPDGGSADTGNFPRELWLSGRARARSCRARVKRVAQNSPPALSLSRCPSLSLSLCLRESLSLSCFTNTERLNGPATVAQATDNRFDLDLDEASDGDCAEGAVAEVLLSLSQPAHSSSTPLHRHRMIIYLLTIY